MSGSCTSNSSSNCCHSPGQVLFGFRAEKDAASTDLLWLKQASLLAFKFSPQQLHPFQVDRSTQRLYAPLLLVGWEENGHSGKGAQRLAAIAMINIFQHMLGNQARKGCECEERAQHIPTQTQGTRRQPWGWPLPTQTLTHGAEVKKLLHSPLNSLFRVLPCPLPSSCATWHPLAKQFLALN